MTVHTGGPYDILVGQGLLEQLPARLEQLEGRRPKLAIVTDSHVDPLYGQQLLERLRRLDPELPYRANTLTRKLNALTRRLKEEKGIEYWKSRRPESRQLTFLRTEDEEEDEEHDGDDDDDDSAPAEEIPSLPSLGSESGGDGDG